MPDTERSRLEPAAPKSRFDAVVANREKTMADELGKLLAGQLGLAAVIANILIDKGVVTREELCERLQQAHDAAMQSSAGSLGAHMLAGLLSYLERNDRPSKPGLQ